jgi:CYTH domain-containing protein
MAIEKEVKYLINKIPSNVIEFSYFEQYYFECITVEKDLLELFNLNSLEGFNTKRIRLIRKNEITKYILTLKTSGLYEREELEKEISKDLFFKFLNEPILSSVKKNRYFVPHDGFLFEFDEYLNLNSLLYTCEVEDLDLENNKHKIEEILKYYFQVEFKDVTLDPKYKNSNITKYF